MAIVNSTIQLQGSIAGMSFYKRRGSDKIIARSKGGASKAMIKNSPKFENLRLQQNEWKGCTQFASKLRYAFAGLHRIADYNLTPALNALAKNIQKTDGGNVLGERAIVFSDYRYTLDGFNFNRSYPFNTILRVPVTVETDRKKLAAQVTVTRMNAGNDLLNVQKLPYFRILVGLGAVSDMRYQESTKSYLPVNGSMHPVFTTYTGEWQICESVLEKQIIEVQLNEDLIENLTEEVTLIVSIAVEFGKVGFSGIPQEVKYAGSGKVIACF
ncbi:conserved hypothetical protein [uncultured Paludibacter sp.]|uniref:Uncharacterized protein n=1 Tax=uncultured Paludibacter sp. TaxID=497635 RepID=A0A653AKM3_9BACT|nr:conserved hypothetical protein [uncultured Paludibacter sp.]